MDMLLRLNEEELTELLTELPTSMILRECDRRMGITAMCTADEEVTLRCEVIMDAISDIMSHFDVEEAKLLWKLKQDFKRDAAKRAEKENNHE